MSDMHAEIDAAIAQAEALAKQASSDLGATPTGRPLEQPESEDELDRALAQADQDPLQRVLKIRVPVIVRLAGRSMRLADILGLSVGSIIEFEKPVDSPLELMVNNKCIGYGRAVKVGEKFGLRIRSIGSLHQKIDALTGH